MKRVDSIVSCEAEFTLKGNELDVDALERRLKEAIEDVCSLLKNQEHK